MQERQTPYIGQLALSTSKPVDVCLALAVCTACGLILPALLALRLLATTKVGEGHQRLSYQVRTTVTCPPPPPPPGGSWWIGVNYVNCTAEVMNVQLVPHIPQLTTGADNHSISQHRNAVIDAF